MQCEACKEEVHPVQEMLPNGAGFTNRCPRLECGAPMQRIEPRNVVGDEVQPVMAPVIAPGDSVMNHAEPLPQLYTHEKRLIDPKTDLYQSAKVRLIEVERLLKNWDSLQAEARRLRAMIAAVEALDAN